MPSPSSPYEAESLDPADWDAMHALGRGLMHEMIEHLRTVRERPVWRAMPDEARQRVGGPVPYAGSDAEAVFAQFSRDVLPYALGNTHPRFWGWVIGTGSVAGAIADLAVSAMNTNASGSQSSAVVLEEHVIGWLRDVIGLPEGSSGTMVTGGSVANYVGIAAGLYAGDRAVLRERGLGGVDFRPVLYTSSQAHFSVVRAARLLGVGEANVRKIATDAEYRIDVDALQRAIDADRRDGRSPVMIAANAGTVGTGAFDPLHRLADLARAEGLWLHVDGAFGGFVLLHDELRERAAGIERADSVALDLHKWLHVPIDAACVLVRDPAAHLAAFGIEAPYLTDLGGGVAVEPNKYTNLGLQQSRAARAVKVWLLLKHFGFERLGRMIYKNVRQAEWLAREVTASNDLELMAPVGLNIVSLRYVSPGLSDEATDEVNRRILIALHERGLAVPSPYSVGGRFALRCSITNHRTRDADLALLVASIREIGAELTAATPSPAPRTSSGTSPASA